MLRLRTRFVRNALAFSLRICTLFVRDFTGYVNNKVWNFKEDVSGTKCFTSETVRQGTLLFSDYFYIMKWVKSAATKCRSQNVWVTGIVSRYSWSGNLYNQRNVELAQCIDGLDLPGWELFSSSSFLLWLMGAVRSEDSHLHFVLIRQMFLIWFRNSLFCFQNQ